MPYYFYGEDTYRARQAIDAIAARAKARVQWLGKEELGVRPLAEWVGQRQGLFGVTMLVVTDPSRLPVSLQAAVVGTALDTDGDSVVLWERGVPDKRSAVWRRCRNAAREFSYLSDAAIATWLVTVAQERGGTLEAPAAQALVQQVGRDGWRLMSELEKLLLQGSPITVSQIERDVTADNTIDIFALLDTLMTGDRSRVLGQVEQLLQEGHGELYVLAMIGYQFRTLLVIDRYRDGAPARIAAVAQLHPYVVEKGLRHLRQLSSAWLLDTLTRVLATDFAIKQGKVDPKTALMLLVWHIADQVQLQRTGAVQRS